MDMFYCLIENREAGLNYLKSYITMSVSIFKIMKKLMTDIMLCLMN